MIQINRILTNNIRYFVYQKAIKRCYTPRRAVLYIPGADNRKITKSLDLKVDCIVFDCEDGVAIDKKAEARENIRDVISKRFNKTSLSSTIKKCELSVRINSVDSGLCEEDLRSILSVENVPSTLVLPKLNTVDDIKYFSDKLHKYLSIEKVKHRINLIFITESCESILNLPELCREAINYGNSNKNLFQPVGIIFGSDDFCASLGVTRTEESNEILYARQKVVLVAKAFNFQAIDMVYIDFKNLEGLKKQCDDGFRMGYTGKQIIHPGQIDIVQESFTPSKSKIKWASDLMESFEKHQQSGQGAFVYQNKMIDMPTMKQAKNIVDFVKAIEN